MALFCIVEVLAVLRSLSSVLLCVFGVPFDFAQGRLWRGSVLAVAEPALGSPGLPPVSEDLCSPVHDQTPLDLQFTIFYLLFRNHSCVQIIQAPLLAVKRNPGITRSFMGSDKPSRQMDLQPTTTPAHALACHLSLIVSDLSRLRFLRPGRTIRLWSRLVRRRKSDG